MNKNIGFLALLLAAACYGSFGVWIRLLSQEMTVYQQIVFRNIVSFFLAVIIIIVGKRFFIDFKKISKQNLLLYALIVPAAVIFYNFGVLSQKIAVTSFVFYLGTILFSTVFGLIFYKEKLSTVQLISLILTGIGLLLFVYPFSLSALTFGFLATIISGLLDAAGNGFRKDLAGKLDKFVLVSLTAVGGIVVSGAMMIGTHQNLNFMANLSLNTWVIGLIFGFILMAVNYLLLIGFQHLELGPGVITLSSELFFALVFGFLVFSEMPAIKELVGGIFILAASIIPNINWSKAKT